MKADIHIVALDETIQFHISEDNNFPYIKEIRSIYMYDKEQQTYCCELQPSYYMIHLYDDVIFNEGAPQDRQDELQDLFMLECGDDNKYIQCRIIDNLIKQKLCSHYHWEHEEEDDDYEMMMEDLREYFCCNHQV